MFSGISSEMTDLGGNTALHIPALASLALIMDQTRKQTSDDLCGIHHIPLNLGPVCYFVVWKC